MRGGDVGLDRARTLRPVAEAQPQEIAVARLGVDPSSPIGTSFGIKAERLGEGANLWRPVRARSRRNEVASELRSVLWRGNFQLAQQPIRVDQSSPVVRLAFAPNRSELRAEGTKNACERGFCLTCASDSLVDWLIDLLVHPFLSAGGACSS
ncbi:MAG: hypothetical protein H0W81_02045 [Chloroflexi bacterium]|nr:hypothetical protein [Chloroflexota bacterium]